MTFNLQMPSSNDKLKPTITVFGVGGAGGNAVNNMINANLEGASFVMANTDAQALDSALTDRVIQLGANITQGLGAGSHPDVGRASAEEAAEEIMSHINGSNMVFITAGMGGGTGTGAAPIIARMAREQGILTVAVVTKPFHFEGTHRMKLAEAGLEELQKYVDTMIVIPNQNLFRVANEKTTFADAFRMADEVLHSGVRGVTDLMVMPGLINLDFSDIRTVMREMGKAMMGTGEADGERRAVEAAEAAISNPLLDDVSMKGARGVLINVTGGYDMTLFEVDEAANRIRDEVDPDANIIFGSTFNESMEGKMRVSVVATGIDQASQFLQPTSTNNTSDSSRNYSTRLSGGSQPKDGGTSARANLSFVKSEPAPEAKKEALQPAPATMAARPAEPRNEPRPAPAQPVRQSQGLRQLRPSLQPQESESRLPSEDEITEQMAAEILEESRADLQGALFDETAEEVIAASAGPRGGIRTANPASAAHAPAKPMQSLRNDHAQHHVEQEEEQNSGFFSRVTSRFAPAAEENPRRVEVKTSRTVVPDDEDYLEIPAFLRRQAN